MPDSVASNLGLHCLLRHITILKVNTVVFHVPTNQLKWTEKKKFIASVLFYVFVSRLPHKLFPWSWREVTAK